MSLNAICSRSTHRTVMKRISLSSEKAILSKEPHKNVICWAEKLKKDYLGKSQKLFLYKEIISNQDQARLLYSP